MSDGNGRFSGNNHARAEIQAAVRYLVNGASMNARGALVQEIIEMVHRVANGLPPGQTDPVDHDLPGG
jgi:hypothetical protein